MTGKLTDLELCKKIAEIEGFDLNDGDWGQEFPFVLCCALNDDHLNFDRDADSGKAPLFDLMVKYGVNIEHDLNGGGEAAVWRKTQSGAIGALARCKFCDSTEVPRAILECIVEANE